MLSSTQNRIEMMLETINRLGIVKIKHLQEIHSLSYRNTCHIISSKLRPYIHETYYQKEKVIYLNKKGRELIASDREIQVNQHTLHSLMRNEVYIHFNCPQDWKIEYPIEMKMNTIDDFKIFSSGITPTTKKVIADAAFRKNGWLYLIEVDNERKMIDNHKKIETYKELFPALKEKNPVLYFFTKTESRKQKLKEWLKGIRYEVKTFEEIR